jgi:DNA-binding NtrC family response regulator
MEMAKILVVDDEEDMLEVCQDALSRPTIRVETQSRSRQAVDRLREEPFDLLIADLKMPELDGLDLLKLARELDPEMLVLIVTGYPTVETAVEAIKRGAFDYIIKPFSPDQLRLTVDRALKQKRLREENERLRKQVERAYGPVQIIGHSQVMRDLVDLVRKVAPTDSNVLIVGESGTGKELVARSLHRQSRRVDKPFVPLDCGALPETLAEAELFGYEKGAFTGATAKSPGLLEIAHGGTFFLDEVCELTGALQVKLLRVLQERQVRRVGGRQLIDVDVRIIAATNRDIDRAVKDDSFREDLFYRLNTIAIHVPPLRERKEDIPLLAAHFIEKFSKFTPREVKGITEEALTYLMQYHWPGNVRELSNVIERAVSLARGEYIDACDLPNELGRKEKVCLPFSSNSSFQRAKREVVESFEREYLSRLLTETGGNVTRAAERAGLPRASFQRLLRKYRIEKGEFDKHSGT